MAKSEAWNFKLYVSVVIGSQENFEHSWFVGARFLRISFAEIFHEAKPKLGAL